MPVAPGVVTMSAREDPPASGDLAETPEFDLECLYDDPVDPSELTIFSPEEREFGTEWVTAAASTAVPLDQIR